MPFGINLPDWKTALQESFRDYVTNPLEEKFQQVQEYNQKTQKMVIAIGFGIFLLLAIAYFWKDEDSVSAKQDSVSAKQDSVSAK